MEDYAVVDTKQPPAARALCSLTKINFGIFFLIPLPADFVKIALALAAAATNNSYSTSLKLATKLLSSSLLRLKRTCGR